jgi:hypothetical protein
MTYRKLWDKCNTCRSRQKARSQKLIDRSGISIVRMLLSAFSFVEAAKSIYIAGVKEACPFSDFN